MSCMRDQSPWWGRGRTTVALLLESLFQATETLLISDLQTVLFHALASAEPQWKMGKLIIFRSLGNKRRYSCSKSYKILQKLINLYRINPALPHILIANDSLILWKFHSTWSLLSKFSLLRHSERHDMRLNLSNWLFPFKFAQNICPFQFIFLYKNLYLFS